MVTKKQQLNFWSKLAESDFVLLIFKTLEPRRLKILAVCFCLAFYSSGIDAAVNSGKIYQLQQRLIEKPSDKEAMLHLAMEYSLQNNFIKAVETYFSLLRVDPNNFHAYNNLGILYKKSGQFRDSIHCYQQAQRIDPDSYWVPYNMGLCYESMGLMQEARESYGRALSLNPGFTQALQRLRNLTEGGAGTVPMLPSMPDSKILIADGTSSQPHTYGGGETQVVPSQKATPTTTRKVDVAKATPEPEKISSKLIESKKKKPEKVRTRRKGPVAAIFNQAMEALEENKIERAIELYARCVIADREFLAEPEGDLIKKGLGFLKDRPNRIEDGLFYRGFLVSVSGNLELAALDMRGYLEQQKSNGKTGDSLFEKEALRITQRYEAELAQRKEMEKLAKEEAAAAAAAREMAASGQESGQEVVQKPSEFLLKRMNVDQIIDEADKLSRSSRQADAIAVLKTGLDKDPDNIRLLMKSANSYTDLLLLKGDQEAGKMALLQFDKILGKAPEKSQEWVIAQEMIKELKGRVRP